MRTWLKTFSEYIEASPTAYHAAMNAAEMLASAGFTAMDETKPWDDVTGARYVVRGGAILAWRMPQRLTESSGLRILEYTQTPRLFRSSLISISLVRVIDWWTSRFTAVRC